MKKNNNSRPVVDDEDENLLKYCSADRASRGIDQMKNTSDNFVFH